MHILEIEDARGDVVDRLHFCSDSCRRNYCYATGRKDEGWNGAHEASSTVYCDGCGVVAGIGVDEIDVCACLRNNVLVNRILSRTGEKCEHGNWIQLPYHVLPIARHRYASRA